MGAEPGEGFVDALLDSEFGTSEDGIGFVHRGAVGAAGAVVPAKTGPVYQLVAAATRLVKPRLSGWLWLVCGSAGMGNGRDLSR